MNVNLEKDYIFGLDIGTRTVIGIVGYMDKDEFVIEEYECIEHDERAMLDGQIHDIPKVVLGVEKLKSTIETRLGTVLTRVSIAAAGRVLDTMTAEVIIDLEELREVVYNDIKNLELAAIEEAKIQLEKKQHTKSFDYFCVGYSVIQYYLDDYMISNLEGHKGSKIGVKLLATFLPKAVIDSLYTVTQRVGLEVVNLTLEPIAAINAIIPEHLRMLNLALVDVGAGTSDIAITKEGSVVSYGMIPIAGDEVTEAIVHQYLVDFNTAERIKHELTEKETIIFEDIIGIPCEVSKEEVEAVIKPIIEKLASEVARKILELNGDKATNAVFCVGGGSQMLGFTDVLCEKLQLPKQRVAVRTGDQVTGIRNKLEVLKTPEVITPLGICITTAKEKNNQFTTIKLNNKSINLLNTKKLTLLDALVASEIDHTHIFGKKGKTLMFKLNGERIRIKGENGVAAIINLNGMPAHLESPISEGDIIEIIEATKGNDGFKCIKDYIHKENLINVYLNGEMLTLPIVLKNGDNVECSSIIEERDEIEIRIISCLGDLLEVLKVDSKETKVLVNLEPVESEYILKDNDDILIETYKNNNEAKDNLHQNIQAVEDNHITDELMSVQVNGETVLLSGKKAYMFANIFDFIEFDLKRPEGNIKLTLNGQRASVTDSLKQGDIVEIYWEK